MLLRCLTLGLSLAVVSVVQAGAVVTLVPDAAGPYSPGQTVGIEVQLSQTAAAGDVYLRMVQFDFNATSADLSLHLPQQYEWNNTPGVRHLNDTFFWTYAGVVHCDADPTFCGAGHFIVDSPNPIDPSVLIPMPPPADGLISSTFGSATELTLNVNRQVMLPASGSVTVGYLEVTLPGDASGSYMLDLVNAGEGDLDLGGQIRFGFGTGAGDEITAWRASAGGVTGGTLDLSVTNGCSGLVDSSPLCGESLWRSANNFILLTFDAALPGIPAAGDVQIQALGAGGPEGADLSADFTFSLDAPNVLRATENGSVLTHRTWYAIHNTGTWANVCDFERDYVLQIGDVNNDGRVLSIDVSPINSAIPCFACPDDRRDTNGDGRVLSIDVSAVNSSIPSFPVAKPGGTCIP